MRSDIPVWLPGRHPYVAKSACWIWVALFLWVLNACSLVPKKPEISLLSVDLAEIGLTEQRFVLRLSAHNPNDMELSIKALDFDVELNDQPLAKAKGRNPFSIPPRGETLVTIDAVSDMAVVLKQLRAARKKNTERASYRVFGSVQLDGLGSIPFERRGTLSAFCPACKVDDVRNGRSSSDKPL